MYKVAVIGKRSDVLGFMALGFRVAEAEDAESARRALHTLAKSREYAVIFLCENYAPDLEEDVAAYVDAVIPAIVPIPSADADNGYGMKAITDAVERAVGADVL